MRRARSRGHSLVEMTVVVAILSLLAFAAVPIYHRAEEQSRVDACAGALRSVWNAQRIHWLEAREYASSFEALTAEGGLDGGAVGGPGAFAYRVAGVSEDDFEAEAVRAGGAWRGSLSVGADGEIEGATFGAGGERVEPAVR